MFAERKRTTALISGIQGGKTIFGAFATRNFIDECTDPDAAFIIGAPTYKILNQSTLPTFKKVFGPLLGKFHHQDARYTLKDGRNVWFRTATDPDSVEGVPNCRFGWVDEAGKCSRKFWVNVEARLARCQGQLLLTTTWYALNWLYQSIWIPYKRQERTDIGLVYFNSAENPTFPKEELERQRLILSRAEFSRKFLGEPSKPEGLIFPDFDHNNWCPPMQLNYPKARIYMGIDWGFDHPMALVVRVVMGNMCRTISIFKQSGLSVSQQLDTIEAKAKLYSVRMCYCGHDRPEMIAELNRRGIKAVKYFEGKNHLREVNAGNQIHHELIRTNRYQVMQGIAQAEDLEDEYLTYSWDQDEDGMHKEREKPVAINDDLMAAERYATVGTEHLLREKAESIITPKHIEFRQDKFDPNEIEKPDDWMCY